ncbi:MAG: OmpA family protein [Pseudomonadota bacterium]
MTFRSVVVVGLLAGSSIVGALAGIYQEAIREKAAEYLQDAPRSDLIAAFQGAEPNPVDAMTDAPMRRLASPQNLVRPAPLDITSVTHVSWTTPPPPKISKIETPGPSITMVQAKVRPAETATADPDTADAELVVANSIDVMKSAAKERQISKPSQLDLILSAMPQGDKVAIMSDAAPQERDAPTVQTSDVQEVAAVDTVETAAPTSSNPVAHAPQQENVRTRPAFSAKHYHNLRYHMGGYKKKKSEIACVAELQLIASYTQVYFDTGSSKVDNRGASAARQIAAKMQSCPEAQVSIIGFTDPGGSKELNQRISWNRANSVFRSIKQAGFAMGNIEVSSHMEDHPDYCVHFEGIDRRVVFEVQEKPKG